MAAGVLAAAVRFAYPLYDFFLAPACYHCGGRLTPGDRYLCPRCWGAIPHLAEDDPLLLEARQKLCAPDVCVAMTSLYRFAKETPIQSLIHELKYGGKTGVGIALGRRLGVKIHGLWPDRNWSACVPVPLHRARKRERGYNQSELICRGIAEELRIPVRTDLLRRRRNTPSQTRLGIPERRANLAGAFTASRLSRLRLSGEAVLLVDDVITTGSTMRECGRALGHHGVMVAGCSIAIAELNLDSRDNS